MTLHFVQSRILLKGGSNETTDRDSAWTGLAGKRRGCLRPRRREPRRRARGPCGSGRAHSVHQLGTRGLSTRGGLSTWGGFPSTRPCVFRPSSLLPPPRNRRRRGRDRRPVLLSLPLLSSG